MDQMSVKTLCWVSSPGEWFQGTVTFMQSSCIRCTEEAVLCDGHLCPLLTLATFFFGMVKIEDCNLKKKKEEERNLLLMTTHIYPPQHHCILVTGNLVIISALECQGYFGS